MAPKRATRKNEAQGARGKGTGANKNSHPQYGKNMTAEQKAKVMISSRNDALSRIYPNRPVHVDRTEEELNTAYPERVEKWTTRKSKNVTHGADNPEAGQDGIPEGL